jgi:hypothetical protein
LAGYLSIQKQPNSFLKIVLIGLAIFNFILSLVLIAICFIEGFQYALGAIIPAFAGYYFLRMYLWNIFGKEIIQISNNHLNKWTDFKYFKFTAHSADFDEISMHLLVDKLRQEIIIEEILDSPIFENENKLATLGFILYGNGKELDVECAIEVPFEHAENALLSLHQFLYPETT